MATRRGRRPSGPETLAAACQELGGAFVKLGQLIGSAPGMFGSPLADAFRCVLDTGPPVPFPEVAAAVEADLGRPLDELFSTFGERPVAAASLAVVHRATLPGGEAVAVKVLRPGIESVVDADLAVLTPLVRFLARQGVEAAAPAFLSGLRAQLRDELDLRIEAAAMTAFRERYRALGLERIVIPAVHPDRTGRRTLTMEFLDGVPIDDPRTVDWDGTDPRALLLELLRAWFTTAVLDGAFHGDLHAGNVMLLRDGRLGLIDWGILGRLDPATHWLLRRLLEVCLGDAAGWREIAEAYRVAGVSMHGDVGLSDRAAGAIFRAQFEPVLTRPLGRVDLKSLILTSRHVMAARRGTHEPESLRERLERLRASRRFARQLVDGGMRETAFDRANLLLGKQLMYVERFGKLYLPDVALLHDRRFLRTLLRSPGPPSPLGQAAGPHAFR
jgi:aarF domain-containing kinase